MDGENRPRRLRSFVIGGIVGASAALATARRLRPKPRRRVTPAGLAAFEDAPCYEEVVEYERLAAETSAAARSRGGGRTGRSGDA